MLEIFKVFSKIGLLGFGGPVATIAMMEREIYHQRRWLSQELFYKAYTLCKILPGPAAAQMAIFLGNIKGGWKGGLLAGGLFIFPGCLMAFILTWIYFNFKELWSLKHLFYGMSPVVLAIIIDSVIRMTKPHIPYLKTIILLIFSFFWMLHWSAYELFLIFLCGLISILWELTPSKKMFLDLSPLLLLTFLCLKAGTLMFGGGFAIVPLLEHPMVKTYQWLTHQEFLDGLTIGLVTPGPMLASVVFFGYKAAGIGGAILAPIAIFLPSFVFIFSALPFVNKLNSLKYFHFFIDGAMASIIGGIIAVTIPLAKSSLQDSFTLLLAMASLILLWFEKIPSWILIVLGGCSGVLYLHI